MLPRRRALILFSFSTACLVAGATLGVLGFRAAIYLPFYWAGFIGNCVIILIPKRRH